jgi:hypothetical protein
MGTGSPGSHAATAANVRTVPASTARSRDLARMTFLPREDCAAFSSVRNATPRTLGDARNGPPGQRTG